MYYYCKAESEQKRARNQELVKMQEDSSIKLQQARRAIEEQIQANLMQTEAEIAEIDRKTIKVKAEAEAEADALVIKQTEDVRRRKIYNDAKMETEKWVASINATFDHIGGTFFLVSMHCANGYIDNLKGQLSSLHLCIC